MGSADQPRHEHRRIARAPHALSEPHIFTPLERPRRTTGSSAWRQIAGLEETDSHAVEVEVLCLFSLFFSLDVFFKARFLTREA
jgi:hypothetical protein